MPRVAVIMGSASDEKVMRPCLELLRELEIDFSVTVSSAHRSPDRTERVIAQAEAEGVLVFICAAGMAAHLAGAVAARTLRPVIGVPILGAALGGMDSLFSTVQMPSGFPVATMALNGAKNAAWLAAQILALADASLLAKIKAARAKMAQEIEIAAQKLSSEF